MQNIKVAIHIDYQCPGSFYPRWIQYCEDHKIAFKIVDCYDSNILEQLQDCQYLLWNWGKSYRDSQFSSTILLGAERMGIKVFPDHSTCWHYEDKVAQKYLLESIGAPLVKSYVFYDEESALKWIKSAEFPKVFKLRKGAGSHNVQLVRTAAAARKLAQTMFGQGINPMPTYLRDARTKVRNLKDWEDVKGKLLRLGKVVRNVINIRKHANPERGYLYFQDFIPNNTYDTRITIIGNRAFGVTRPVRPNDFRASGSGKHRANYNPAAIDLNFIRVGHDVAVKIGSQSLAFDFIHGEMDEPLIVEISYSFPPSAGVSPCNGYWDRDLKWIDGQFNAEDLILEDLLSNLLI